MRGEGNHKIPGSFAPENMEKTGAERVKYSLACQHEDAIPIKFVSYALKCPTVLCTFAVALRKESVDRNVNLRVVDGSKSVALRKESVDRNREQFKYVVQCRKVALRKESVDRNCLGAKAEKTQYQVALRKESVDRNVLDPLNRTFLEGSLSARRAWIEIMVSPSRYCPNTVSLSARRAWIEILGGHLTCLRWCVALRKESVDRNCYAVFCDFAAQSRSPQGERG